MSGTRFFLVGTKLSFAVKAVQINEATLTWSDCEIANLGAEELRITVHASAVNRADLLQRRGAYPPPPAASKILGLECLTDF